jgi:hypothetical protein
MVLPNPLERAESPRVARAAFPASSPTPSPSRLLSGRIEDARLALGARTRGALWSALHVLGAHHWQDGYETDTERGWSRYRGTRCTVCDSPWEGW